MEKISSFLAFLLPKRIAYWCAIRVFAHAYRIHSDAEMGTLSYKEVLDAWEEQ